MSFSFVFLSTFLENSNEKEYGQPHRADFKQTYNCVQYEATAVISSLYSKLRRVG